MKISTYLTFNGNCQDAFNFYKSVFGGEFSNISKFSDLPLSDGYKVSEEEKNNILHIALPIGDSILYGSDNSNMGPKLNSGNNFSLNIEQQGEKEGEKSFNKLAEGGKVIMPFMQTFWAKKFGMIEDKFGINWMINITY